jgi:hypothetical protein
MGRDGDDGDDEIERVPEFTREKVTPELKELVWEAVKKQYPKAVTAGVFAGLALNKQLVGRRFERLADILNISGEEALEIVLSDTTPLLVSPEGVQKAFDLLAGLSGNVDKALALVRVHPGLLVGGARSLKQGSSLVTNMLVDVLFAGRLVDIAQDSRPQAWKLAEIEFYASVAALFKPVMDLVQRRSVVT